MRLTPQTTKANELAPTDTELRSIAKEEGAAESSEGAFHHKLGQLRRIRPAGVSFTNRVMEALSERPAGLWQRIVLFLEFPSARRIARLTAVPMAVAVGITAFMFAQSLVAADQNRDTWITNASDFFPVSFSFAAPGADSVAVAGDFNEWNPESIKLSDTDRDGTWTVTLSLRPGDHRYMFVVDGQHWVLDPGAESIRNNGDGMPRSLVRL